MPTITLNKEVLEKLVGKKLSLDKLRESISYLGTDLESIEGNEITVEVFPNRPDLLSEQGFARALSSFIGAKTGLRQYKIKQSNEKVIVDKSVKNIRPYTACAIVKNLSFDDEKIKEIIQIQEKLHVTFGRNRKKAAIGIYPYEKIKPPIRFIAKKPSEIKFRPLEFPREITGLQMLSQHPAGRDYGYLLEGLDKFPIFIDANDKILSMPPIINSHDTGKITDKTKDVFIECSGFDFNVLKKCLNMIVTALADMGGDIYSMQLVYPDKKHISPDLTPQKMKLDIDYINKRLGLNLSESSVKKLLEKMGYDYRSKTVLVPAYRADVIHPIDLAEDIAIAYGYNNFKEEIPKVATIGSEDKFEIFQAKIANILVGLGLLETNTYCLTNKDIQSGKMECDIDCIELENSLSQEYNVLRSWLIPNLIQVLAENKHNEFPQKIFTLGNIFKKNPKEETGVEESVRAAVVSCNDEADFTEIKQMFDYLMRTLDLKYKIEVTEHTSFIKGRVGRVVVKGEKIAYIGEISPKVLNNFSLTVPVVGFELNLTDLFKVM